MNRRQAMKMARMQAQWYGLDRKAVEQARWGERLTLHPWERAVAFRDGASIGVLEPGRHRFWNRAVTYRRVDLRPWILQVPTQEVPTADGIAVKVSVAATARVADPVVFVTGVRDADEAIYLQVQVAVREVFAALTVEALLAERASLGERVAAGLGDLSATGVAIDGVEVKDLVLPGELRRAQAQALVAKAEGLAALERARSETAALRGLANAARLAAEQPTLLQLRLLQELGQSSGHTVVVGGPSVPQV
jgi:regulator of protease activity HflC (stomatin/prohibitin superfamily)